MLTEAVPDSELVAVVVGVVVTDGLLEVVRLSVLLLVEDFEGREDSVLVAEAPMLSDEVELAVTLPELVAEFEDVAVLDAVLYGVFVKLELSVTDGEPLLVLVDVIV
jgi:hypothetical protein